MAVGIERDIQDMLIAQRKTKRGHGNVSYPIPDYSACNLVDLDIWDNMFFESIWGSPTIYNFPTPPNLVLDVGCGTGWWIINMARRWQNTRFVGFDIAEIQPRLVDLEQFRDVSDRISWVHGNFLDVFPFPNEHFDYVRVCRAGLAIPEDEWQWFLEQGLWGVMRTGGLLEIIEEDLIFPTATLPGLSADKPIFSTPERIDSQLTIDSNHSSGSSSTKTSGPTTLTPTISDDQSSKSKRRYRLSSIKNAIISSSPSSSYPTSKEDVSSFHYDRSMVTLAEPMSEDIGLADHPQNHSKLKAAWDSMLSSRFISNKVLSVLPFYLSTVFSDVEIFHLYTVPLPTNTPLEYGIWDDGDSLYSFPRPRKIDYSENHYLHPPPSPTPDSPSTKINPDNLVNHPIVTELPRLQAMDLEELAGMHLHYAVEVIKSCKDAIQKEYQKLFPAVVLDDGGKAQKSPRVLRMMESDLTSSFMQNVKPEPFDVEWHDWLYDMEDRMRLRKRLPSYVDWDEPRTPRGGKPTWRHWRKTIDKLLARDNKSVFDFPANPSDICRSVRAYMAWKGVKPEPVF